MANRLKSGIILFIMVLTAFFYAQTVNAADGPLLENGDFEDADTAGVWIEYSNCLKDHGYPIIDQAITGLEVARSGVWLVWFSQAGNTCTETASVKQQITVSSGSKLKFYMRNQVSGENSGTLEILLENENKLPGKIAEYRHTTLIENWTQYEIDLSSYDTGVYTLIFSFRGIAKQPVSEASFLIDDVELDSGGAIISGLPQSPTRENSVSLTISGRVSDKDISDYRFEIVQGENIVKNGASVNIADKLEYTDAADGVYDIKVWGKNADGDEQPNPTVERWIVDTTPPTILTLTSVSAGPVKTATWNWTVGDQNWTLPDPINPITYYYVIDQNPTLSTINETDPKTVNTASKDGVNGDWYIHVKAKDAAGNVGRIKDSAKVLLDNTAPTLTITRDPDADSNSAPYTITLTATDANGVKQRQYRLNTSQTWINYSDPVTVSDAGTHTFFARAEDNAGNETLRQISFTIAYRGNINGDTKIDLKDAILALKILAGLPPDTGETVKIEFSVDEMKIALADVIYVLQVVSRSRTAF